MNTENTHIRAFIAVSLPEEIKFLLQDLQRQLQKTGIKASWPNTANLHLTLKFLGNINLNTIAAIKDCMTRAAAGIPPHTLSASGIGVFPSVKRARVIWSGTRGQTDVLERLAHRLEEILFEDLEIKKENRRFSPHLTLARIQQPIFPKTLIRLITEFKDFQTDVFLVSRIHLFQSELNPSGAVHKLIFSAPLEI